MSNTIRPGIKTTEFWVTFFTQVAAIVALVDPQLNLSGYVQTASFVAAAIVTLVYSSQRHQLKTTAAKHAA